MFDLLAEIIEFIAGSWWKGQKKKPKEPTEKETNE